MKKIKYIIISLLIGFAASCSDSDDKQTTEEEGVKYPKQEMRAAWVATVWNLDLPLFSSEAAYKQSYVNLLDAFQAQNLNAVVVQVRPKADAFWPSATEPWSRWLTGSLGGAPSAGFDPLAFWIEETHKRGMEFHAWFNPYDITTDVANFTPHPNSPIAQHPEWTMEHGPTILNPGKPNESKITRLMLRPSHPDVPAYLVKVIKEVADKYNIDGVHFDDYFYPYPIAGVELDDADDYAKYGAGYKSIEDFRRGCVNKAIEQVSTMLKTNHPDVLFSVSPYAVWRNKSQDPQGSNTSSTSNYDDLYSDVRLWCEKGWLDFVVPQLYGGTATVGNNYATFEVLTKWWAQNSFDVPVIVGYPLYRVNNPAESTKFDNAEFARQLRYGNMEPEIKGGMHYSGKYFQSNFGNALTDVLKEFYKAPAVLPFMGRATVDAPTKVQSLSISNGVLSWNSAGTNLRYAVYRINKNVATIQIISTDMDFPLEWSGDYMITAVNADNVESEHSDIINYKKINL